MAAKWFYRQAGAEHGPVSSGKIRRMVARGELEPTDLLWKVGMEEWRPAGESAKLFGRDDARPKKRQRDPAGDAKKRPDPGRAPAALTAAAQWTGRRPLLTSIGIGVAAGVVISAMLAAVIVAFSGSLPEEIDAPAVAVVAPHAKPEAAKPAAPPQPAAVKPAADDAAAAQPAPAQPAPVETVAVVAAPPGAEKSPADPADPSAEPQPDPQEPELPADLQAVAPPKPQVRIRVRLPGEDF